MTDDKNERRVQRYDEELVLCKFFRKKMQKNAKRQKIDKLVCELVELVNTSTGR